MSPPDREPFRLSHGARLWLDDVPHTVTGITDDTVRLRSDAGTLTLIGAGALLAEPTFRPYDQQPDGGDGPRRTEPDTGALLDRLGPQQRHELLRAQEHFLELTTGYRSGSPDDARPGEPRPAYAPERSLTRRVESKAAELGYTPVQMWRKLKRWREEGLWGLVDRRSMRRFDPGDPGAATRTRTSTRTRVDARTRAAAQPARTGQPGRPHQPLVAHRPGEVVLIDTASLDTSALDPGTDRVVPVDLTIALDLCTRSLLAWRLTPAGSRDVDAGLVIADALMPEPMRPDWPDALRHRMLRLPCEPLLSADERFAAAAARPVIFPERIVVDRGAAVASETVKNVCRRYGICVQDARSHHPDEKPHAEAAFRTIRTQFAEHLSRHGDCPAEPATPWTVQELEELFAEYVVAGYQRHRPAGPPLPGLPGLDLSPNEAYRLAVHRCGYIAAPRDADLFLELLPIHWTAIHHDGVCRAGLRYQGEPLRRHAGRPSPYHHADGAWPIRYDPRDLTRVYFHDPATAAWSTIRWTHALRGVEPFTDVTLRQVRRELRERGRDPYGQEDLLAALTARRPGTGTDAPATACDGTCRPGAAP